MKITKGKWQECGLKRTRIITLERNEEDGGGCLPDEEEAEYYARGTGWVSSRDVAATTWTAQEQREY